LNTRSLLAEAFAFHQKGDLAEADRLYLSVLAAEPDNFDARHWLGLVRSRQGRVDEAIEWIGGALKLNPKMPEALSNYGNALRAAGRLDEALASYDRALAVRPDFLEGRFNRANALKDLGRIEEALVDYDRALAIKAAFPGAWNNRGNVLRELRRYADALESYGKALALRPGHAETLNNCGLALWELRRFGEALAACDQALALRPDFAEAWNTRGGLLSDLQRFDEALECYDKAFALDPRHPHALNGLASAALNLCDWERTAALAEPLKEAIAAGRAVIQPFLLLGYFDDPALQLRCAGRYLRNVVLAPPPLWTGGQRPPGKIRLAYLSADFRNSAAAYLTAELFERHDRSRFEVTAISFGPDDASAMRARLMRGFDRFEDVRGQSDREVAALLHARRIDIAIDLMGYTLGARAAILAHRPCPVQASWLGYAGSMAADFIDYVIADRTVLPEGSEEFYAEKIVRLPHSYYPSDSTNPVSDQTPTRAEAGLPEQGLVFCCFNNSWKITVPVFDIWMRLLAQAPGSMLWLLAANPGATERLHRGAAARGIDPARIVFAGRLDTPSHLARHQLADLFLDTLPYNAHTTATDALWAGLPVVTCMGTGFSARVAASLLRAIGLDELVTGDLEAYEALALKLARDPAALKSIRQKLARNQLSTPLFDAEAFRRALESAYETMTASAGGGPRSFDVEG
jgi:protein O-GlcNAc transferase